MYQILSAKSSSQ